MPVRRIDILLVRVVAMPSRQCTPRLHNARKVSCRLLASWMRLLLRPSDLVNHLFRQGVVLLRLENERVEVGRLRAVLRFLPYVRRLLTPPKT